MTEETIAAGEFKAKCLKMMADVERTGQALIITKRGKPLVKIMPYIAEDAPKSAFGCMKGSAILQEMLDEHSEASSPIASIATAEPEPTSMSDAPAVEEENPHEQSAALDEEVVAENRSTSYNTDLLSDDVDEVLYHLQDIGEEEQLEKAEDELDDTLEELEETSEKLLETPTAAAAENTNSQQDDAKEKASSSYGFSKASPFISRTPPPNRGLPIDSATHHKENTSKTTKSAAAYASEDDSLYVPSLDEDESDEFLIDDFLDEDESDDNIFEETEKDNNPFLFQATEDDLDQMEKQLQSETQTSTASGHDATQDMLRKQLSQQFTSAWNRMPGAQEEES